MKLWRARKGSGVQGLSRRVCPSIDIHCWGCGTKQFITQLKRKCHAVTLRKWNNRLMILLFVRGGFFSETMYQKFVIFSSNNDAQEFFRLAENAECLFCSCFVNQNELMKLNCIFAYLVAEPHESCFALKENTEQFPASLAFYLKRGQQFIFQSVQGFPPLLTSPNPLRHWYY